MQTISYSYPQNELARKLESAYNMLMIYVCENQTNTWKQWEGKKWSLSASLNVWYLQSVFFVEFFDVAVSLDMIFEIDAGREAGTRERTSMDTPSRKTKGTHCRGKNAKISLLTQKFYSSEVDHY